MNLKTPIASACALLLAGLLSACSLPSGDVPEINQETTWVEDYPALGEPVSAAAAVRAQGDSRLPALDDVYDAVLEITPAVMDDLVAEHPDLTQAEIDSFVSSWLLDGLPEGLSWQHSDTLDAALEDQDDAGLIVNAYLAPDQNLVVLVLMEM